MFGGILYLSGSREGCNLASISSNLCSESSQCSRISVALYYLCHDRDNRGLLYNHDFLYHLDMQPTRGLLEPICQRSLHGLDNPFKSRCLVHGHLGFCLTLHTSLPCNTITDGKQEEDCCNCCICSRLHVSFFLVR